MAREKLGGNIVLSGFDIDNAEKIVIKKMVGKYAEKMRHFAEYQEILLTMKKNKENKTERYEINGLAVFDGGRAEASAEGFNPFILINEVMQKIIKETENKFKNE